VEGAPSLDFYGRYQTNLNYGILSVNTLWLEFVKNAGDNSIDLIGQIHGLTKATEYYRQILELPRSAESGLTTTKFGLRPPELLGTTFSQMPGLNTAYELHRLPFPPLACVRRQHSHASSTTQ